MKLHSFWLLFVLLGLLLMLGALAYAAAPIAGIYAQALNDPLGNTTQNAPDDGKLIMKQVFSRLPLAIPGTAVWIMGVALRVRAAVYRSRARRGGG